MNEFGLIQVARRDVPARTGQWYCGSLTPCFLERAKNLKGKSADFDGIPNLCIKLQYAGIVDDGVRAGLKSLRGVPGLFPAVHNKETRHQVRVFEPGESRRFSENSR